MRHSIVRRFRDEKREEDFAFVALLKDCSKKKDLEQGQKLHADILKKDFLRQSPYLSSSLISMYGKCGALEKAQEVLYELPVRNVVSWNALISGYAQHGHVDEALSCLRQMRKEGILPNAVTFICILKACIHIESVAEGEEIHEEVVLNGLLEKDVALGTTIVDMYAKCGALARAREVLEQLPVRNTITWNALISGYAQDGQGHEALKCFERMQSEGLSPDSVTFLCVLKACGEVKDLEKGKEIHDEIVGQGLLDKDVSLGNALVDMCSKCGMLTRAEELLNELPSRNVVTWNALITGYAQQEQGLEALECFERMQSQGFSPDEVTLVCVLKLCGQTRALEKGKQIHEKIAGRSLLEKDTGLGNALVDMYAKCGELAKAHETLEMLCVRNVGSWSAMIAGHVQQEQGHEALDCYGQMEAEGLNPDVVTLTLILKVCGIVGAMDKGKEMHARISREGFLEKHVALGTALVDMYAKCGKLSKARRVLEELPTRNVITWSALIAGFVRQGDGEGALNCFECMKHEGLSPDALTFMSVLKACGHTGNVNMGRKIHEEIAARCTAEEEHGELVAALVYMYSKCNEFAMAQELLKAKDVSAAWNALIEVYAERGRCGDASNCLRQMQGDGFLPDVATFVCVLQACGSTGSIDEGKWVHEMVVSRGLLSQEEVVLGTALVDMYAKCGELGKAHETLREAATARDVVSWNSLISGYAHQGRCEEALDSFGRMLCESLCPDAVTFVLAMKACASKGAVEKKGKAIHAMSSRISEAETAAIGNALVDMYAKCGVPAMAESALKDLRIQNVVAWNACIAGHVRRGRADEALACFERMRIEGLCPDASTFACASMACARSGARSKGERIHAQVLSSGGGLMEADVVLVDALVDMYSKCGMVSRAHRIVEQLRHRDVVSWNALIGGYAQQGSGQEAFGCLRRMQIEGLSPDAITFTILSKACAGSRSIDKGELIHVEVSSQGLLARDVPIGNALIEMYARCGRLGEAQRVMEELLVRDVVSWNTLIARYAERGRCEQAMACFRQMQREGISPDSVTLLCVLSACSRSGHLLEAEMVFGAMRRVYGIDPKVEHRTCMVLAFGCGGQLDKAMSVIDEEEEERMPASAHLAAWLALLGVCRKWGNLELARLAFGKALGA